MPVMYFKGFRGGWSDLRRAGMDLRESSQSRKRRTLSWLTAEQRCLLFLTATSDCRETARTPKNMVI